jgi:ubiquinone/menaquinone biosynthesis C-methylase UbiE
MATTIARKTKPYKGMAMEGPIARWYARNTASNLEGFRAEAREIVAALKPGDVALEVAPGPGYLSIEMARAGRLRVVGLDVSHSFVKIATANAKRENVAVEFRQGNASALPFADDWFDFIVCRAAFKNFGDPQGAVNEMRRVLRPGATALIRDMRRDATNDDIAAEVANMGLHGPNAFMTRLVLRDLRRRAYAREDFARFAHAAGFSHCEINEGGIGLDARLTK